MKRKFILVMLTSLFLASCGERIEGPKGITGIQGIQGEVGEKGEKGITGEQGPQGAKGAKGYTGAQGLAGDKGIPGEKGESGDTGDKGAQGPKGEQGPQGVQGEQGEQGDKGATPDSFSILIDEDKTWIINGADSDYSAMGPQGPQGEKGDQGEKGAQGETYYGDLYSVVYLPSKYGYVQASKAKYKVDEDVVFNFYPNNGYRCALIEINQNGGYSIGTNQTSFITRMVERGLVVRAVFIKK